MTDDLTRAIDGDVHNDHFDAWVTAYGHVARIEDATTVTELYAFDVRAGDPDRWRFVIPSDGACYGFVQSGRVHVSDPEVDWSLRRGQWFTTRSGCRLDFGHVHDGDRTRIVVAQRRDYRALQAAGGPVETHGRLRYIDQCSDTLLAAPARLGDPCLNLLHFPRGIEQTMHVHPSVRCGVVARGRGWCETPHGVTPLEAGLFFSIPANGKHRFLTDASTMDVIAYHPDSDWGPTDEEHPMLSRTWRPEGEHTLASDKRSLPHDPTAEVIG